MDATADIGTKIQQAIAYQQDVAADATQRANAILDAWSAQDYGWLRDAGVISTAEMRAMTTPPDGVR